jgi:outer membrane protein assembly factor BamB
MKLDGEEMYVYCASGGIVGVSAATGKILWEYDGWQDTTQNVPMPVMLGDGRFLVSVSYKPGMPKRIGAMVVQLAKEGAQYTAKPVATIQQDEFASEQQTPVFYNGNIFCVRSPAGIGQLICTDLVGKTLWTSGEDRFGIGPYMIVDGVILAMDDNGVLSMIEASASGYKRLARAKVASNESWAPMALVDGRLIVRDITKMYCVDLRGKQKN